MILTMQLFYIVYNTFDSDAMSFSGRSGNPVNKLWNLVDRIFDFQKKLVVLLSDRQSCPAIICRRLLQCVHCIFERIGQDRTNCNIRAWKLCLRADIAFKTQVLFRETCLVDRNHGIKRVVFAVGRDDCVVIGVVDLLNIFLRLFRVVLQKCLDHIQVMTHIVPQDGKLLPAVPYLIDLLLDRHELYFHQVAVLADFLLLLEFFKIHKKKNQICNAESEAHKFHNCFIAGIEKIGKLRCCIVKDIVYERKESDNAKLPFVLGKNCRRGAADKTAEDHKDQKRCDNTREIIAPILTGEVECEKTDPGADLTAQIGRKNRGQTGNQRVMIIKN